MGVRTVLPIGTPLSYPRKRFATFWAIGRDPNGRLDESVEGCDELRSRLSRSRLGRRNLLDREKSVPKMCPKRTLCKSEDPRFRWNTSENRGSSCCGGGGI